MIKRIDETYELSQEQEQILQSLRPFQPGVWNIEQVSEIKNEIRIQLLKIQNNNCCYCGLKLNEGGRAEIEHIANKGGKKRPAYIEFVFYQKNLAIVCQFCNSSSKKGQEDILDNVDLADYENCTFKIVHPYFDNPDLHFSWTKGKYKILISSISNKGEKSIELFGLTSEAHTLARAKQVMFEKKLAKYNQRQEIINRIKMIFRFREN